MVHLEFSLDAPVGGFSVVVSTIQMLDWKFVTVTDAVPKWSSNDLVDPIVVWRRRRRGHWCVTRRNANCIPRHSGWVEHTSTHMNIEQTGKYIQVATVFFSEVRPTMIRMGVSGWMFLLVPAYPGCPGSKAVKRSLLGLHLCLRLSQILFTVLHCPVAIYIALLRHALYSSLLYKMPCVHRTPMLLLSLLYECSVTTVLLSGASERRHYQRIGPSLTPLTVNNRWTKSLT